MAGKTRTVSLSLTQEMYNQVEEFAEQMEISKSELLRRALKLFLTSRQWKFLKQIANKIKNLPLKDLPDYLENPDNYIRKKARERCNELIGQLTLDGLPQYLTHCNCYIRKKAVERFDQLQNNGSGS